MAGCDAELPPPGAGPEWGRPIAVGPASAGAGTSDLGIDARGNVYVAWSGSGFRESPPSTGRLIREALLAPQVAVRQAGETTFGPPQILSAQPGGTIDLAVAPDGTAVAAWEFPGGLQVVSREPGGEFGPPQTHGPPEARTSGIALNGGAIAPQVSIGADGSALVAWNTGHSRSRAIFREGSGPFRSVRALETPAAGDVIGAVNNRGDMALIWTEANAQHTGAVMRVMTRLVGRPWSGKQRVGGVDPYTAYDARLALTPKGDAMVKVHGNYAFCPAQSPCREIEGPRASGYDGVLVGDDEGGVHAIWSEPLPNTGGMRRFLHSTWRQGEGFARPLAVARAKELTLFEAAAGPAGQLMLAWGGALRGRAQALYTSLYGQGGWGKARQASPIYASCRSTCFYSDGAGLGISTEGQAALAWFAPGHGPAMPGLVTAALEQALPAGPDR